MSGLSLTLDGVLVRPDGPPEDTLLSLLWRCGKLPRLPVCRGGNCSACLVGVDGCLRHACRLRLGEFARKRQAVVTPRALETPGAAWLADVIRPLSCGVCAAGMAVAAMTVLAENEYPVAGELERGLLQVPCPCGGRPRLVRALWRAARESPREPGKAFSFPRATVPEEPFRLDFLYLPRGARIPGPEEAGDGELFVRRLGESRTATGDGRPVLALAGTGPRVAAALARLSPGPATDGGEDVVRRILPGGEPDRTTLGVHVTGPPLPCLPVTGDCLVACGGEVFTPATAEAPVFPGVSRTWAGVALEASASLGGAVVVAPEAADRMAGLDVRLSVDAAGGQIRFRIVSRGDAGATQSQGDAPLLAFLGPYRWASPGGELVFLAGPPGCVPSPLRGLAAEAIMDALTPAGSDPFCFRRDRALPGARACFDLLLPARQRLAERVALCRPGHRRTGESTGVAAAGCPVGRGKAVFAVGVSRRGDVRGRPVLRDLHLAVSASRDIAQETLGIAAGAGVVRGMALLFRERQVSSPLAALVVDGQPRPPERDELRVAAELAGIVTALLCRQGEQGVHAVAAGGKLPG